MTQATSTYDNRNKAIKAIHSRYEDFYRIGGGLTVIILLILIGTWIFGQNQFEFADTMLGYITNVATEALSVVATIIVIDQLNRRREREDRKLELFDQAKSRSNDMAIDALEKIQRLGWWDALLEHYTKSDGKFDLSQVQWSGGVQLGSVNLEGAYLGDANLEGANLPDANLERAYLYSANLEGADLRHANLEGADLRHANLERAYLYSANLQRAHLAYANLEGSYLRRANLQEADLSGAKLQGARLQGANLEGATLAGANLERTHLYEANLQRAILFNANLQGADLRRSNLKGGHLYEAKLDNVVWQGEINGVTYTAILPDGNKWTEGTDMERFTDREHAEYVETLKKIKALRDGEG